jgi:hypothetical protein
MIPKLVNLHSDFVYWIDNIALYGEKVATQPIVDSGSNIYNVSSYDSIDQDASPIVTISLWDNYGQQVRTADLSSVYPSIVTDPATNCGSITPTISAGYALSDDGAVAVNGTVTIEDLYPVCNPGGSMYVSFEVRVKSKASSQVSVESLYFTNTSLYIFRECESGEIDNGKGGCSECSTGTYSLEKKQYELQILYIENWHEYLQQE